MTALREEDRVKGTTSTDLITTIFLGLFGARGGGVIPCPSASQRGPAAPSPLSWVPEGLASSAPALRWRSRDRTGE